MLNTLMLIDDSDVDLLFTSVIIERSGIAAHGLQFETAQSALQFLRGAEGRSVDAILLDINMPVMDGFAFLDSYEGLRALGQVKAVVVMLTNSPDPCDRERALAYPSVRDYVVKPINIKSALALATRVRQAVEPRDPS